MHSFHNVCKKNEIVSSKEMKDFEKHQFLKKSSYSFMQKRWEESVLFIRDKYKQKQPIIVLVWPRKQWR